LEELFEVESRSIGVGDDCARDVRRKEGGQRRKGRRERENVISNIFCQA